MRIDGANSPFALLLHTLPSTVHLPSSLLSLPSSLLPPPPSLLLPPSSSLKALLHAAGTEEEKRLKAVSSSGSLPPGTEPFPCKVFAGKTMSVVTCGGCQAKSQVTERFVDLSLNIPPELLARPDDVPRTSLWGSGVPWGRKSSTGTRKNLFTAGGGADSESDVSSSGDSDTDGSFFAASPTGKQDASSVEECLERFVQRETLEAHEGVQWKCPKCTECTEVSQRGGRGATKQVTQS